LTTLRASDLSWHPQAETEMKNDETSMKTASG
jgi:hypothetical protein